MSVKDKGYVTPFDGVNVSTFPVYERVRIAEASSAKDALATIGHRWDNAPYEGEPFTGSYVFEVDGHRFTVSVDPVAS